MTRHPTRWTVGLLLLVALVLTTPLAFSATAEPEGGFVCSGKDGEETRFVQDDGRGLSALDHIVESLDIQGATVISRQLVGNAQGQAMLNLGSITVPDGSSFTVLHTGVIGHDAEPGIDWAPAGAAGDSVTLILDLDIEGGSGSGSLGFVAGFLSADYPELSGPSFVDEFRVTLEDDTGSRTILLLSADSPESLPVVPWHLLATGFNLFSLDPFGPYTWSPDGYPDATHTPGPGSIPGQNPCYVSRYVTAPYSSSGTIRLIFKLSEQASGFLDSAALLNALTISPDDNPCDDGVECTIDSADPWGECVHAPDDASCDDGLGCTFDYCNANSGCDSLPNNSLCEDGVECTQDTCDTGLGCQSFLDHAACDDSDDCTDDVCVGSVYGWTPDHLVQFSDRCPLSGATCAYVCDRNFP